MRQFFLLGQTHEPDGRFGGLIFRGRDLLGLSDAMWALFARQDVKLTSVWTDDGRLLMWLVERPLRRILDKRRWAGLPVDDAESGEECGRLVITPRGELEVLRGDVRGREGRLS